MNALTKLKKKQWVNLTALELCVSENNMEKFVRVKAADELAAYQEIAWHRDELQKENVRLRLVESAAIKALEVYAVPPATGMNNVCLMHTMYLPPR